MSILDASRRSSTGISEMGGEPDRRTNRGGAIQLCEMDASCHRGGEIDMFLENPRIIGIDLPLRRRASMTRQAWRQPEAPAP